MTTPTQRTLELLRSRNWTYGKVETFNRFAGAHGQRKDLFGFADFIALDNLSIIAIQSCGQAFSEHNKMILCSSCTENVIKWLRCGGRVILIGWRKVKVKRGGKAMVWKPREYEYTLKDFGVEMDD